MRPWTFWKVFLQGHDPTHSPLCELRWEFQRNTDMALLEAIRLFPAAIRTFTKRPVRLSTVGVQSCMNQPYESTNSTPGATKFSHRATRLQHRQENCVKRDTPLLWTHEATLCYFRSADTCRTSRTYQKSAQLRDQPHDTHTSHPYQLTTNAYHMRQPGTMMPAIFM
jgi:hypothetical protein